MPMYKPAPQITPHLHTKCFETIMGLK